MFGIPDFQVLDRLSVGVWMSDASHQIIFANSAALDIAGIESIQVVGINFFDLPEDLLASLGGYFLFAVESRKPVQYECVVTPSVGRHVWLGGWLTPLDDNGRYAGMICTLEDISNRKQTEESLFSSKQRLELALSASGLGLWDVDLLSGKTIYDERWCAMLGYLPEEIADDMKTWEGLIHPEDRQSVLLQVEAHLSGATEMYQSEHRLRHKNGYWVWIASKGRIVTRDSQGIPLRVIGTHQNISDRKRLKFEGGELLRQIESLIRGIADGEGSPSAITSSRPEETPLSARQREVLTLVASGLTSADIAARLGISHATVLAHRRDIARKLGLHSTAELTRYAIKNRLLGLV